MTSVARLQLFTGDVACTRVQITERGGETDRETPAYMYMEMVCADRQIRNVERFALLLDTNKEPRNRRRSGIGQTESICRNC